MQDFVYQNVMRDIKQNILQHNYEGMKLPDERSLAQHYEVSRSSMKRALGLLAEQGIVFKKRGSGTFINPLYLKRQALFRYDGSNLGITDSYNYPGKKQTIRLLDFHVLRAPQEVSQDLFLPDKELVYYFKRLRLLSGQPFLVETGYLPVKIAPELSEEILQGSLFNYLQNKKHRRASKSFLSITVAPSNLDDQKQLLLRPEEPVGVMSGIFFLDDGTPFEVSNMRVHYRYMRFNHFVSLQN